MVCLSRPYHIIILKAVFQKLYLDNMMNPLQGNIHSENKVDKKQKKP